MMERSGRLDFIHLFENVNGAGRGLEPFLRLATSDVGGLWWDFLVTLHKISTQSNQASPPAHFICIREGK